MDEMTDHLTQTTRVESSASPRSSAKRKSPVRVSSDLKQHTAACFRQFSLNYKGVLKGQSMINEFVRCYPECSFMTQLTRKPRYDIIGPLFSYIDRIKYKEEIKSLFSEFYSTYTGAKNRSAIVNGFCHTHPDFVQKLTDREQRDLLGPLCDTVSDTPSDAAAGGKLSNAMQTRPHAAEGSDAMIFPGKLYDAIQRKPHLYRLEISEAPRPIPGESEWVRSELVKIAQKHGMLEWKALVDKLIECFPLLQHYKRLTACQFQNRFGSAAGLCRGDEVKSRPCKRKATTDPAGGISHVKNRKTSIIVDDQTPPPSCCQVSPLTGETMKRSYSNEDIKRAFHRFLKSYDVSKISRRVCLTVFTSTDERLLFLRNMHTNEVEKILGGVNEWRDIHAMACQGEASNTGTTSGRCDDAIPKEFESVGCGESLDFEAEKAPVDWDDIGSAGGIFSDKLDDYFSLGKCDVHVRQRDIATSGVTVVKPPKTNYDNMGPNPDALPHTPLDQTTHHSEEGSSGGRLLRELEDTAFVRDLNVFGSSLVGHEHHRGVELFRSPSLVGPSTQSRRFSDLTPSSSTAVVAVLRRSPRLAKRGLEPLSGRKSYP